MKKQRLSFGSKKRLRIYLTHFAFWHLLANQGLANKKKVYRNLKNFVECDKRDYNWIKSSVLSVFFLLLLHIADLVQQYVKNSHVPDEENSNVTWIKCLMIILCIFCSARGVTWNNQIFFSAAAFAWCMVIESPYRELLP